MLAILDIPRYLAMVLGTYYFHGETQQNRDGYCAGVSRDIRLNKSMHGKNLVRRAEYNRRGVNPMLPYGPVETWTLNPGSCRCSNRTRYFKR